MALAQQGLTPSLRGNVFRIGETRAVSHLLADDSAFSLGAGAAITIYDATGAVIVNAQAVTYSPTQGSSAKKHTLSYPWATTGRTAGEYSYFLSYGLGGETLIIPGSVLLIPLTSKLDPYFSRMVGWVGENHSEAKRELSLWDYWQGIQAAVTAYSHVCARRLLTTISLTASVFEYDLPGSWVEGLSSIVSLEYPVDDSLQDRAYLKRSEYVVEEARTKWRFRFAGPNAGETARMVYTTRHALDWATDTLPAKDFESITQYGAGACLKLLANATAGAGAPSAGADFVSPRTRQQEYRSQAHMMMEAAEALWTPQNDPDPWGNWDYLPYHGHTLY